MFSVSIVILNPLFVLSESFDFYQCESMQIYSFSVRLVSEDPSSKLKLLLDYVLTEVFFFCLSLCEHTKLFCSKNIL